MAYERTDPNSDETHQKAMESNTWGAAGAYGFTFIPYNNFPALLHEGEQVLTASQAREYRSGSGASVVVTGNTFTVREEADIGKIAKAIVEQFSYVRMAYP